MGYRSRSTWEGADDGQAEARDRRELPLFRGQPGRPEALRQGRSVDFVGGMETEARALALIAWLRRPATDETSAPAPRLAAGRLCGRLDAVLRDGVGVAPARNPPAELVNGAGNGNDYADDLPYQP